MKILNFPDVLSMLDSELSINNYEIFETVNKIYPVKITDYYLSLAIKSKSIFYQAFPSIEELYNNEYCDSDPLNEEKYQVIQGLIHKYTNKVIILTTNCCFMNCRHCTRKRLMHSNQVFNPPDYEQIYKYIKQHKEINDILLTGGDALTLDDNTLFDIIGNLEGIDHINTIRIGTRALVTYPERITNSFCKKLEQHGKIWINTQFNHPDEITEQSKKACKLIQEKGVPICNQTVILKGVNDNVNTLRSLFLKLVNIRVIPYYLYQCDNVKGVSHFVKDPRFGANIIKELYKELPGIAIPRYIIDTQNKSGKIVAEYSNIIELSENSAELIDYYGNYCYIKYGVNSPKIE